MEMETLSIFGSCMSRDAFRLYPVDGIELKSYVARQSVHSAVEKPPLKHLTPLTSEDLKKWIDELGSGNKKLDDMWHRARANRGFPPERRPGNPKEALDLLDQLFPESINDEG